METPENYKCSVCNASDVKLWRQYNTCADYIELMCRTCALKVQKETELSLSEFPGSDAIGWMVPAVPCDDTYWGYTSVPKEGCDWWNALPGRGRSGERDEFTIFKDISHKRAEETASVLFPQYTWKWLGASWGKDGIRFKLRMTDETGVVSLDIAIEQWHGQPTTWHVLKPGVVLPQFAPIHFQHKNGFTYESMGEYLKHEVEEALLDKYCYEAVDVYTKYIATKPWHWLPREMRRRFILSYARTPDITEWVVSVLKESTDDLK